MQDSDSLGQRIRDGLLLDVYGTLITEKQRLACEMVLLQDLSLSEAAESLKVSRQGVHDLITRAREHMENAEKALGLLEKESKYGELLELLENNRDQLPKDFYLNMKKLLEA
ncbi:MAG: DNA-binding protein [Synergistaceae bacterium]|nr:DNA-binding protein [Synergistaceae bacterium]MDD3673490.1 DNA-binding protein [Synergistaceae bacterium]MDD3964135.1 DNA-binding protein [Synergistaceae bacterium]